jgi:TRAP-type mannitol/chloroaromatic compound transport system permease large subunit
MASLRPWIAPVATCLAIQAVWFGIVRAIDLKLLYQSSGQSVLSLSPETPRSDGSQSWYPS